MQSGKYLSYFLKMRCSIDIQKKLHPKFDSKEITECMAVFEFLRNWLHKHKEIDLIIDVGSGKFSVLGLLYAFNYKIPVISVDPRNDLKIENMEGVNNFTIVKGKLKDIEIDKTKNLLLLANHSHVPKEEVEEFIYKFDNWNYLTVPCCYNNRLEKHCVSYQDKHIWSDKNTIYFYQKGAELL